MRFLREERETLKPKPYTMNNTIELLCERRSVKSYKKEQVSEELLQEALKAATFAPTGRNSQSPVMVVVQKPETVAQLSRMNAEIMGVESDPFYGAPTVVVILGNPEHSTWLEDGCLVAGNLMNGAAAVGLGSCWIHRCRPMFESAEGKALLKEWGLDENLVGVANIILGYQDAPAKPRVARKEDYIVRIR